MTARESLKQNVLTECGQDHVGLWSIIRDAEEAYPKQGQKGIRNRVLRLLRELLIANEVKVGFPTVKGGFITLQGTPQEILAKVESDWPEGKTPNIGEGLWFSKADKPNLLSELVESVKNNLDAGNRVAIDPKKYGFKTKKEYWQRIRELAGVRGAQKYADRVTIYTSSEARMKTNQQRETKPK